MKIFIEWNSSHKTSSTTRNRTSKTIKTETVKKVRKSSLKRKSIMISSNPVRFNSVLIFKSRLILVNKS